MTFDRIQLSTVHSKGQWHLLSAPASGVACRGVRCSPGSKPVSNQTLTGSATGVQVHDVEWNPAVDRAFEGPVALVSAPASGVACRGVRCSPGSFRPDDTCKPPPGFCRRHSSTLPPSPTDPFPPPPPPLTFQLAASTAFTGTPRYLSVVLASACQPTFPSRAGTNVSAIP